jgi:hypothetical protein
MLENWHIHPVSFKHYQRFAADYSDGLLGSGSNFLVAELPI